MRRKRKPTPQPKLPVPHEPDRTPDDPKPDQQAAQPLVPHEPDRTPVNPDDPLIQKFAKAHDAFERTFCKALQYAKDAGEALLKLQSKTGLKGIALFAEVRKLGEIAVSDRSCYLYQRIGSRWNLLQIVAGDKLNDLSLTQAIKLLGKEEKPTQQGKGKGKPTPPSGQAEAEGGSDAAPSVTTNAVAEAETEVKPEATTEEPIKVQPPFDQPDKDRLAAVFAQNGPAATPIQLMTNIVIPNLKRVAEGAVNENEVPFLANAISEVLALIEALKAKYAIM
jgi:hypothetical protein